MHPLRVEHAPGVGREPWQRHPLVGPREDALPVGIDQGGRKQVGAETDQAVAVLSTPSWPLFATLGVLGAGFSFILYIVGLNHTTPTVASIVAMVEPVTASLFGFVVLDETLVGLQIFGMALILVTVTALSTFSNARQRASDFTSC